MIYTHVITILYYLQETLDVIARLDTTGFIPPVLISMNVLLHRTPVLVRMSSVSIYLQVLPAAATRAT